MMILRSFMILVVFLLCSSHDKTQEAEIQEFDGPKEYKISPGFVELVYFKIPEFLDEPKLNCKGETVKYWREDNRAVAYISESYFSDLTPYDCYLIEKLEEKDYKEIAFHIDVTTYDFPAEYLNVDKKKVLLPISLGTRQQQLVP